MRPEIKVIDTVIATQFDSGNSAANNVITLCSCTNGTGVNQRIGNSISLKSLEIVGAVYGGTLQTNYTSKKKGEGAGATRPYFIP